MTARTWALTLGSVLAVSAVPMIGILGLSLKERAHQILPGLISFAAGALLGGAMLHLLPAAIERFGAGPVPGLLMLTGFIGFFAFEKFLWHHHRHDAVEESSQPAPVAMLSLLGDALHNLVDGVLIAATFTVDTRLGFATTLAIFLHEVPQELGDLAILLHAGVPFKRAILLNLLSALAAVIGAVVTLAIGGIDRADIVFLLPIAAGGFIYIAAADLVPEMRKIQGLRVTLIQIGLMLLGVAVLASTA